MMSDTTTETSPATATVQHPDSMIANTFEEYVNHDEDLECSGMPMVEDICSDILQEEKKNETTLNTTTTVKMTNQYNYQRRQATQEMDWQTSEDS